MLLEGRVPQPELLHELAADRAEGLGEGAADRSQLVVVQGLAFVTEIDVGQLHSVHLAHGHLVGAGRQVGTEVSRPDVPAELTAVASGASVGDGGAVVDAEVGHVHMQAVAGAVDDEPEDRQVGVLSHGHDG